MRTMQEEPSRHWPTAAGPHGVDPSLLRISDEDRRRVTEVLRQAAGEGRIDLGELDERLEATFRAKTYGDLVPITADLPSAARPTPVPAAPRPLVTGVAVAGSVALMSTTRRTGPWIVDDSHTAVAVMGTVGLDLRRAQLRAPEVVVNATAVMGEVKVVVGPGTHLVVDGLGVMGEFTEQRPKAPYDPSLGGPVVRVRGFALMGAVHVQRKATPGAWR